MRHSTSILLLFLLLWSTTASAVLIDAPDGAGNTTAPAPDPGWDHVAIPIGLTAVHLGEGWVLTAYHVGEGDVTIGGIPYPHIPGSGVRLHNPDDSLADLMVYAIYPFPAQSLLPIASSSPPLGTPIVWMGNGRDRGAATSWDSNGPPPPGPIFGYEWQLSRTLRWGTNHIEDYPLSTVNGSWAFVTYFDPNTSDDESQAVNGDSGGPAFAFLGGQWTLVGTIYSIAEYGGQPAETSLYGQITYAADLAIYRDEILEVTAVPEPTGGLPAGMALLATLGRRARRRFPSDAERR